jgi:hypothetical protein
LNQGIEMASPSPAQRRSNLRLALILATIALAFGLGFVARFVLFGR